MFFFFLCANIVSVFEPYAMGKLITTLQFGGKNALNEIVMRLVIM